MTFLKYTYTLRNGEKQKQLQIKWWRKGIKKSLEENIIYMQNEYIIEMYVNVYTNKLTIKLLKINENACNCSFKFCYLSFNIHFLMLLLMYSLSDTPQSPQTPGNYVSKVTHGLI